MAFFQTDLDPIYLREKHREILPRKHNNDMVSKQQQQLATITTTNSNTIPSNFATTKIFHHLFKGSSVNEKCSSITSDPINRLISFHL
jgi:hypothetical protein